MTKTNTHYSIGRLDFSHYRNSNLRIAHKGEGSVLVEGGQLQDLITGVQQALDANEDAKNVLQLSENTSFHKPQPGRDGCIRRADGTAKHYFSREDYNLLKEFLAQ